ncbi:unnamed protein product [Alopecurus aequalis]
MGDPEPEEPQTLAAGELVWAKTKGRPHWHPARLPAACPAASKDAPVSCFADDPSSPAAASERRATRLRRFADPAADKMARDAAKRGFLGAVDMAHAAAVALLCTGLTCACAAPAPPPPPGSEDAAATVVVSGVANLSPSEFLAALRRAALDPAVGLVDRARLKSWARALAHGWGPAGAGRYTRRSVEELVDKIDLDDLNEPAGEEVDAAAVDEEDSDKAPLKTPAPKRRKGRPRKDASLLKEDTDAVDQKEDEKGDQEEDDSPETAAPALSTGRKRMKSKYLSPPYTDLIVHEEKKAGSPKEALPGAAKVEKKKVSRDNVGARDVLELVRSFGDGSFHEFDFPKAEQRFLGLLRSSTFAGVDVASLVSDSGAALKLGKSVLERSRKKDEAGTAASSVKSKKKMDKTSPTATLDFPAENVDFPMENVVATDGADVAGLVSDSSAALKKGKGVRKRSTKKDQDGSGGPSVKRKKVEKASPKATPTLPEKNVSANTTADGTGLVPHSCATLEEGKSVTKRGRKKKDQDGSATLEEGKGVTKRGRKKKDQDGSGGSSIKRKRMNKTSPAAIPDSGLVITPAIPIRQVRAEDMLNQMKSGAGAGIGVGILDQNKLVLKSPVSAAMPGGLKLGEEQDQGDGGSVVMAPVNVEATLPETDMNMESVVADLPAKSVQAEEAKPGMGIQVDMNVQSDTVDVPISGVLIEPMGLGTNIPVDTNEQGALTDLLVRSGLLPKDGGISQPADGNTNNANVEVGAVQGVVVDLPVISGLIPNKHGSISEPADGNTDAANVEVRTAQESYASLEAMVPEMYKKVDDAFVADGQKGEQTSQKKSAGEAIANPAPAVSTNGACSDTANTTTPKRRTKKAPQYFANPAEILLDFTAGVIPPTKEELLLAFSKFGVLIEPLCGILEDIHGARVVFGRSADAEAVYSNSASPGVFGQFGPPFASMKRLNYLPPFTPSIPPPAPAPKLPLGVADMRKNVENMISSLAGKRAAAAATSSSAGTKTAPEDLLGEMQRLLLKLDSIQGGSSSGSARAPPP